MAFILPFNEQSLELIPLFLLLSPSISVENANHTNCPLLFLSLPDSHFYGKDTLHYGPKEFGGKKRDPMRNLGTFVQTRFDKCAPHTCTCSASVNSFLSFKERLPKYSIRPFHDQVST